MITTCPRRTLSDLNIRYNEKLYPKRATFMLVLILI